MKQRTGIEEYAYQTIKHLCDVVSQTDNVVLYVRKKLTFRHGRFVFRLPEIDFTLPAHWQVRGIWAPRFWTQIGLSWEMLLHSPGVLFIPAHTVPIIHPRKTIVTIHGLEYEFCKEGYSLWARLYMRFSIRFSCRAASSVICVSENTKNDVMKLYGIPQEKIRVVYEGCDFKAKNPKLIIKTPSQKSKIEKPYLLFIGRLEERKNIARIIEAFEALKEKYKILHKLALVGKPGYGYRSIKYKVARSKCKEEIIEVGYVSEEEKWELLGGADVFVFPTLYEGFGLPVLEAQRAGVPAVTSKTSALPEVAGAGAVYVDPMSAESIAEGVWKILSDKVLRDGIIKEATHNVNRFSWAQGAQEVLEILI